MFSVRAQDFDRISVALAAQRSPFTDQPGLVGAPHRRRSTSKSPKTSPARSAGRGEGLSLSVGNAKPVQPAAPKKAAPVPPAPVRGSISPVPRPTSARPRPLRGQHSGAVCQFTSAEARRSGCEPVPAPFTAPACADSNITIKRADSEPDSSAAPAAPTSKPAPRCRAVSPNRCHLSRRGRSAQHRSVRRSSLPP
jgi:hypothetical protein